MTDPADRPIKPTRPGPKRGVPAKGAAAAGAGHTMSDIATLAGVSAMTVSRALKADGSVSPATREKILKVIAEVGYVPDETARTFASGRSGFVAALVPSINNSNFADTARGLTDALQASGLQLLLGATDYALEREEELIASMLRRRPEAMVLTGGVHTARARQILKAAGIPIVEIWDLPKKPLDHVVGFSNADAGKAMVAYLVGRGYTRIGFIGGSSNRDTRGADRRAGFLEAIEAHGLPPGRVISFGNPPISMEQGGQAIALMLEQWPDVEAVMCVSDLSAFGALMECRRRGWDVPGRIAIAGFGDFEIARCCSPSITTVAVDCYGIGRRAGRLALDALAAKHRGSRLAPETVVMEFHVVGRETA